MINPLNGRRIAGLAAFVVLLAAILGYYILHKPFSPDVALALARVIWQFFVAWAIFSLAGGLGRRFLPLCESGPLVRISLQAGLGLGFFSLGGLLIGAMGGFRFIVAAALMLVLAALLWRQVLGWWRDGRSITSLWQVGGWPEKLLAYGVALIFLITLVSALAPATKFDALVYHLALPQIYISEGRLVYVPQNMFWGMPQNGEMLNTWAMLLGGEQAAVLLGWLAGGLALAGLAGYVLERSGISAAWTGVAALLSGFTLASALSWGYVDWLAVLYGLLFLVSLDIWIRSQARSSLILAGIFLGLAVGVKYTAGVLVIGGLALILWERRRKIWAGATLVSLLQLGLPAGLVFIPWLLKNFVATGNPVYPYIFPSGAMSVIRLALYQGGPAWGNWQDTWLLPFRATFFGVEGGPGYSASIGALLLGLSLAAWLTWPFQAEERKPVLIMTGLLVLPVLLLWMLIGRFSSYLLQSRLYFAIFPALAVQAGLGLAGLQSFKLPGLRLGFIASILVVLVLWLNVIEMGVSVARQSPLRVDLGLETPQAYLEDNLGWYAPAMQGLRDLPQGSKALMLWEPRSLYCWPVCEPDEILDRWLRERYPQAAADPRSADEILQSWRQAGYTYLLYHRSGASFLRSQDGDYRPEDWQALDELFGHLTSVQEFSTSYTLYSLGP